MPSKTIAIDDLYPEATLDEELEAEGRLQAYVRLVLRIEECLQRERVDEQGNATEYGCRPPYQP